MQNLDTHTKKVSFELYKLNTRYIDHQKFRKQARQRVWAICSRCYWDNEGENGKLDKIATSKLTSAIISGKYPNDNPFLLEVLEQCHSFLEPHKRILEIEKGIKKQMSELASSLPEASWVEDQKGFGIFNFARLIGSIGREGRYLDNFTSPPALWLFFGMNVIGGSPQGGGKAPKIQDGEFLGFDPERRAAVYNLGESLIKNGTSWKALYDKAKKDEHLKAKQNGLEIRPSAKIPKVKGVKGNKAKAEMLADIKSKYMSEGHVHNRARRHMVKKAIKELWIEANPDKAISQ